MRALSAPQPNHGLALRAPDNVSLYVLAASTPESHSVPSGAAFVEIRADAASYVSYIMTGDSTDLVTNGAFATDTGWTKGTGWTIGSGVATSDASQTGQSLIEQTPTGTNAVISGKAYRVTFTVTAYTAGNVRPKIGGTAGTNRASAATFTETIVAGSDGVIALDADADFSGSVDNLTVVPVAHIPTADQTTGYASEYIPANVPTLRYIKGVSSISMVSAGTPKISLSFWGDP